MSDCLFCKIAAGEIPCDKVYEDETCLAFKDIKPLAPVHVLVVCKQHADNLSDAMAYSDAQLAACLRACAEAAKLTGLDKTGYRVVCNNGADAGQTVGHLHFHVLGGRVMGIGMV